MIRHPVMAFQAATRSSISRAFWRDAGPSPAGRPASPPARRRGRRPSTTSTAETTRPSRSPLAMRKWASAKAAIWGRWVMTRTWWPSARRQSFSPTTWPERPPTPTSTSSKTRVGVGVGGSEDRLQGEHQPRRLAAGGDAAERLERLARVRRDQELDAVDALAVESQAGVGLQFRVPAAVRGRAGLPSLACGAILGLNTDPAPEPGTPSRQAAGQCHREAGAAHVQLGDRRLDGGRQACPGRRRGATARPRAGRSRTAAPPRRSATALAVRQPVQLGRRPLTEGRLRRSSRRTCVAVAQDVQPLFDCLAPRPA